MNWQAFDNGPGKAGGFDFRLTFLDFCYSPDFANGNMMQSGYDTGSPGLSDVGQGYRVVRPVPTPGLFECRHKVQWMNIASRT